MDSVAERGSLMDLGQVVHYLCTETGKCQAALVTDILGESGLPDLALNVQRPPDHPNPDPVERKAPVPYASPELRQPGSWHRPRDHAGFAITIAPSH
jgi:hypothetical protein